MASLVKSRSDEIRIICPMCSTVKRIKKTRIKDKKFITFRCTCGTRFHKRILRKDFTEIDIISAIARFDVETIWFKLKRLFFLSPENKSKKIRLA